MDPLCKRFSLKRVSSSPPPWNPSGGCDIVIANPWGSLRPLPPTPRPLQPPPVFSVPMMISSTCPQHGRLFQKNKSKMSRCDAFLDGLPSDSFTIKLTFTIGLCKLFCGIIVFLLGLTALPFQATLAGIGAGLWAGMVTLISGVAGLMTSKLPRNYAVLVTFLCWSITSLVTSVLLTIFSATGLTKDISYVYRVKDLNVFETSTVNLIRMNRSSSSAGDDDGGAFRDVFDEESFVSFDDLFRTGRPAVIINAALVTLAVVDCLVSIMAIILASSETCVCCVGGVRTWGARSTKESRIRQDRLIRWIQQQRLRLLIQPPPQESLHRYTGTLMANTSRRGPGQLDSTQTYSSLCRSYVSDATTNSAISVDSLNKRNLASNSNCEVLPLTTTDKLDSLTDEQVLTTYSQLDKQVADDFIRRSLKGASNN